MSGGKRIAFALAAVTLSTLAIVAAVLAMDLILHRRAERYTSVNRWGYRGRIVGAKRRGERRLVMLGGSTTLGYGVRSDETIPAYLEKVLQPSVRSGASVTVVNLGMNGEGAYAFVPNLEDYRYLDYDAAILYEGYNDGGKLQNILVSRRDSPVFRLTGYYPIFPVYFYEKAMAVRTGDIDGAYRGNTTVFKPGAARRVAAAALEGVAALGNALDGHNTHRKVAVRRQEEGPADLGCAPRWALYCESEYRAITYLLEHGKKVLVASQPLIMKPNPDLVEQQAGIRRMLALKFAGNPNVFYVDAANTLDSSGVDKAVFYDSMHLRSDGNYRIAEALAPTVIRMFPDALGPDAVRRGGLAEGAK